jgi:hypothetical protein
LARRIRGEEDRAAARGPAALDVEEMIAHHPTGFGLGVGLSTEGPDRFGRRFDRPVIPGVEGVHRQVVVGNDQLSPAAGVAGEDRDRPALAADVGERGLSIVLQDGIFGCGLFVPFEDGVGALLLFMG